MIDSARVRELMQTKGLSQSELARRVSVTQGLIAKIVGGKSAGSSHLHKIARELGTSAAYLTGEIDDPTEGAMMLPSAADMAAKLDLVAVDQIELEYGLGGAVHDGPAAPVVRQFSRAWLKSVTDSPASALFITRGRGDSMQPTIHNGDMLIVDRSQRTVREQDAIWAITIGEIGMVKRLRVRGENVMIVSDNVSLADERAHAAEVNVVGRVVFVGRRM